MLRSFERGKHPRLLCEHSPPTALTPNMLGRWVFYEGLGFRIGGLGCRDLYKGCTRSDTGLAVFFQGFHEGGLRFYAASQRFCCGYDILYGVCRFRCTRYRG